MNCPKCNKSINEFDKVCRFCGNILREEHIENLEEIPNFNQAFSSQNKYNETDYLYAYIGKNAEKIIGGKWSWCTFFFNYAYFLYRKMWLLGIFSFIITTLLLTFLNIIGMIIILIGTIILAILFKKIYVNHAKKEIIKIKNKNPNSNEDEIYRMCSDKGGTALWAVIIYFVLMIIFIVGIVIAIYFLGWKAIFNTLENGLDIDININKEEENILSFNELVDAIKNDKTYGSGLNFLDTFKEQSTITTNNNEIKIVYSEGTSRYTTIFKYQNGVITYNFHGNKNSDTTRTQVLIDSCWITQILYIVGISKGYSDRDLEKWLEEYDGKDSNGIKVTNFSYTSMGYTEEVIDTFTLNINDFNIENIIDNTEVNDNNPSISTESGLYYQVPSGFNKSITEDDYAYYTYETEIDDCSFSIKKSPNNNYYTPTDYLKSTVYVPEDRLAYGLVTTTFNNTTWGYLYYETSFDKEYNYAMIENNSLYHLKYKIYEDSGLCSTKLDNLVNSLTFK